LNDVNWKYHLAALKEGGLIFAKIASVIVISCALFASLITLFDWVILPILFFVVISVYAIWMVGTISITQKKWDEERNKKDGA